MSHIGNYFLIILKVFLILSSALIIFMFIKFMIINRQNKKTKNYGFRGRESNIDINNSIYDKEINREYENNKMEESKVLENEKIIKYDNGEIYKGELIEEKRSGFGICVFPNGDRYEGLWKEDMINSIGKYVFNDGSVYVGDFKNNKKHGMGTYSCNLYKYVGNWKDDLKDDVGTYYFFNKTKLDVIIKDNKIIKGVYITDGNEDRYVYNLSLENEKYIIENIEDYITTDKNRSL